MLLILFCPKNTNFKINQLGVNILLRQATPFKNTFKPVITTTPEQRPA
jgi:hypothetical protein